jgi:hypothetical protein
MLEGIALKQAKQPPRYDMNQELSSAQDRVDQISGELSRLKAEIASSGSGIGTSVDDLVAQMKLINDCIPELQAEVTSETYYSAGSYITPSVQLSRYCSDLIYGGSTGGTGE